MGKSEETNMNLAGKIKLSDAFGLVGDDVILRSEPYFRILLWYSLMMLVSMIMYPSEWIVRTDDYAEFALMMIGVSMPAISSARTGKNGLTIINATYVSLYVLGGYLLSVLLIGLPQTIVSFALVVATVGLLYSSCRAILFHHTGWFICFCVMVAITSVSSAIVTSGQPDAVREILAGQQSILPYLGMIPVGVFLLFGFKLTSKLNTGFVAGSESGVKPDDDNKDIPVTFIDDDIDPCIGCQAECNECDDFLAEADSVAAKGSDDTNEQFDADKELLLDKVLDNSPSDLGLKMDAALNDVDEVTMASNLYVSANNELMMAFGGFLNTVQQLNRALLFIKPENMERDAFMIRQLVDGIEGFSQGLKFGDHERTVAGAKAIFDKWHESQVELNVALLDLDDGANIPLTACAALMSIQLLSTSIDASIRAEKVLEVAMAS